MSVMPEDITPQQLRERLDRKEPIVLLDVRDGWETALCRLENAVHIPLEELEFRVDELDPEDEIVVYCHHGIRSAAVAGFLRNQGFARAVNLAGGLDAWAQSVDRSMRRY
jgi:rhodanese-related sulfurtransferase